ncbi:hypothetical protein FB45DRAFT_890795 [Roridomyces roridus]|uniref:F-box domain-containing protein n=1 Tax=Roridomyces roridus TaxID=1738132 RepID=A0AAD7CE38_9AGAR|nr:hypothetical protein FB45DRAFT_890795 [Roridomyces roridus]
MLPSSPFSSKLGTNYCPHDHELDQIHALLVEPRLRLQQIQDEIAVLQRAIDKLAEERDRVTSFVDAHRALTSPIRRLPLDIIEEIFCACLPVDRNCVMSWREAPILLGRICSGWRAISLATPRLWSRLHVVEPTRPYNAKAGLFEAKVAHRLETTQAWLERSGMCSLSISLESNLDHGMTPPLTPSPAHPNTTRFLNAITPFSSRWQNIRLVIPPLAFDPLSTLTEEDVPLLTHLEIVQRPEHPHSNTQWDLSSILRGANLSAFSISGSNVNPSDLPLRWGQLTELSIMGPAWGIGHTQTSEVVLQVLTRCPQLRSCKLLVHDNPGVHPSPLPESITSCAFLHTVELLCVGSPLYTSGRLLSRLSLPELRHFKLRGHGEPPGATAWTLSRALAPSTRLESIDIDSDTFSKGALMDFLRGLPPTVRRLEVMDLVHAWHASMAEGSFDDEVLAGFVATAQPFCPALRELVIAHCRLVTDEALLRFVESRVKRGTTTTLRLVDVQFDREAQTDLRPLLQRFVGHGEGCLRKVLISYNSPSPLHFSPWQGLPDAPVPTHGPWGNPHIF